MSNTSDLSSLHKAKSFFIPVTCEVIKYNLIVFILWLNPS